MRLEKSWRGDMKGDRGPRYTLTDFARRKGVEPDIMYALFTQTPNHPPPLGRSTNGYSPTNAYSLRALEAWWRNRPVGLGEVAREVGTTAYKLGRAGAAYGVQPVATGAGKRAKHFYPREAVLAAWSLWDGNDQKEAQLAA